MPLLGLLRGVPPLQPAPTPARTGKHAGTRKCSAPPGEESCFARQRTELPCFKPNSCFPRGKPQQVYPAPLFVRPRISRFPAIGVSPALKIGVKRRDFMTPTSPIRSRKVASPSAMPLHTPLNRVALLQIEKLLPPQLKSLFWGAASAFFQKKLLRGETCFPRSFFPRGSTV